MPDAHLPAESHRGLIRSRIGAQDTRRAAEKRLNAVHRRPWTTFMGRLSLTLWSEIAPRRHARRWALASGRIVPRKVGVVSKFSAQAVSLPTLS